jgi:uncharacterized protein DUF885
MTESTPPIPRPQVQSAQETRFYEAAEKYLDASLNLSPVAATYYGYHRYDGELDDYSAAGIRERISFYEAAEGTFAALDRSRMSPSALIDLDLVVNDVESSLFSMKELKPHENNPGHYNELIGYGTLFLTILEEGDPAWPARLASLHSRLKAVPDLLAAARANLGCPPRIVTEFILQQNPANISFLRDTLPRLYGRAPHLQPRLEAESRRAIAALQDYQRFLEGELLSRSSGDWRLGRDLWTRKLRLTLQSDLRPEQILERAWSRLRSEREAMLQVAEPIHARLFPGHAHAEKGEDLVNAVVREVIGEISKRHSTPETLFEDVKGKWVPRTRAFIRKAGLLTLPDESDNFVVERTPGFLDGLAVAFFQPPPAFEPHLKKSYWISSIPKTGDPAGDAERAESFLREYNDYGLQSLTIHEALPGHYVQFWYAMNSPFASIYKKIYANNTFAEGWAVLAEEQMFKAGYAEAEPECLLIHKKINLRTPINAILDARLHTEPMTEAEADRWALDLMRRYGFQEEAEATFKLRRAKITSTQLSTYFVGLVELGDLMEECMRRDGARFSLKAFNERLLSYGTIPPRAVRRLMLGDPGCPRT